MNQQDRELAQRLIIVISDLTTAIDRAVDRLDPAGAGGAQRGCNVIVRDGAGGKGT